MTAGLDTLQFHGSESPEFCARFNLRTIKAFRVKDSGSLGQLPDYGTDAWLLDSYVNGEPGGTGERFNWDLAVEAKRLGRPLLLAGGLTPDNAAEAIAKGAPFGVDVSSRVEAAPGQKDSAKVAAFIASLIKSGARLGVGARGLLLKFIICRYFVIQMYAISIKEYALEELVKKGYKIDTPWDAVDLFEKKVAETIKEMVQKNQSH